tara:strand:+ start:62 stop:898 length:837 start_codon:yes stop_codon:yes gene_type:complete
LETVYFLSVLILSSFAGLIGSLLGLGGGFIIVPGLNLLFDIPIHLAIATSFLGVLVTSNSSSLIYIKNRMTNIRLASILESGAIVGTIIGATISLSINKDLLSIIFSIALFYTAYNMNKKKNQVEHYNNKSISRNELNGEYFETSQNKIIKYSIKNIKKGISFSFFGGIFSGLLGIGGGAIFVPIMNKIMRVPLKVSIATSSFIIGITSFIGALVFLKEGFFDPVLAAPTIIGMFIGAQIGPRINQYIKKDLLLKIFIGVLIYIAIRMLLNGLQLKLI